MNRCSGFFYIRDFPKFSPIEKQMLSWLQKGVRPKLHRKAQFHVQVDTPNVLLDAPGLRRFVNGNCLWIAFVSGKDRILQPVVNQFAIDKYVLRTDIYKPAEFDLFCLYDRFEPEKVSSQSNMNDS